MKGTKLTAMVRIPWLSRSAKRCDCPCHGNPAIMHIAPCCARCPKCGGLFSAGIEEHERTCDGAPPPPPSV